MIIPQEFIRQKRDGKPLDPDSIAEFIQGVSNNTIPDAQISALCMAIVLKGLSITETAHLTRAMAESGTILKWGDLASRVVDKHSTGGVGDTISLMLAPIVAACGLYVPMIAGRGLGHTGGTIDKLESIPGFQTTLSLDRFQHIVREIGCAIIGQTDALAPADRRMYAVRDITATVESVPLITASILSKKLAAGLTGLVMDIKCGNGAFMTDITKAQELAQTLTHVAEAAGLNLTPVISDMNQILGHSAGNAVEVLEAVEYLTGARREPRTHELTLHLATQMLMLGGVAQTFEDGHAQAEQVLDSGKAAEIFARMVAAQGGPSDILDNARKHIGTAPIIHDILADQDGMITHMETRDIGVMLVHLKAGRTQVGQKIDPHIGLTDIAPLGTKCIAGETILARVHLCDDDTTTFATETYQRSITIDMDAKPSASQSAVIL